MDHGSGGDDPSVPVLSVGTDTFEEWYVRVAPRVRRTLVVAAGDDVAGGEAADEAFVKAFVRWRRVSRMANPEGWVYRVAINQLRRRSRNREDSVAPEALPVVPTSESAAAVRIDLMRALAALPRRERQVFAMRCVADLSEAAVADALGIAPGTVSRLLYDARARLRVLLGDETDAPPDRAPPPSEAVDGSAPIERGGTR